jgi:hypothetical protein
LRNSTNQSYGEKSYFFRALPLAQAGEVRTNKGGSERRNSKRKERLKRRNTNELNFKMTETPKMKNKQENVSNFNIKLFCLYCPPY